jgi:transcriptional regulator with XRE-family HTH domain
VAMSEGQKAIAQAIGQRIRDLRTEREWSQERLARAVDRSLQTIYAAEAGRRIPDWETLERLAGVFRLDPRELLQSPTAASRKRAKASELSLSAA